MYNAFLYIFLLKSGEGMNYSDVVNHDALKAYFGEKSEKWITSLNTIIDQKRIGHMDVDSVESKKLLYQSRKWSWLGFFFTFFWAAYHNVSNWIQFSILYVILHIIDTFFLGEVAATAISVTAGILFGMLGRTFLLDSKAQELSKTGNLTPPSWVRVGAAILIIMGGIFGFTFVGIMFFDLYGGI